MNIPGIVSLLELFFGLLQRAEDIFGIVTFFRNLFGL